MEAAVTRLAFLFSIAILTAEASTMQLKASVLQQGNVTLQHSAFCSLDLT